MVNTSRIAVALAIVLGLGTAASAAPKKVVHNHHATGLMAPRGAYNSFGYAPSTGQIHEPINMYIQDQDWRESVGLPYGGP
jgi:hypothetical protein